MSEERRWQLDRRVRARAAELEGVADLLLYSEKEWTQLESRAAGWLQHLGPGGTARVLELVSARGPSPKSTRQMLLAAVREAMGTMEFLQRSSPFPLHLTLIFAADCLDDALALLFAARGKDFQVGGPDSARLFESCFVNSGDFSADVAWAPLQLRSLARQARHLYLLGDEAAQSRLPWRQALAQADKLLAELKRFVLTHYTSEAERRARKKRNRFAAAIGTLVSLGLLVAWVVNTRPLSPIGLSAVQLKRRGKIKATYFKDKSFGRAALTRYEPGIRLHAPRAPIREVGADHFSVRWDGYLFFPRADKVWFCLDSDDGSRLYLKGRLVVSNWGTHARKRECDVVRVRKGWYPLRVDFFDDRAQASLSLSRGDAEDRVRPIPATHLCCDDSQPAKRPRAKDRLQTKGQRLKVPRPFGRPQGKTPPLTTPRPTTLRGKTSAATKR